MYDRLLNPFAFSVNGFGNPLYSLIEVSIEYLSSTLKYYYMVFLLTDRKTQRIRIEIVPVFIE